MPTGKLGEVDGTGGDLTPAKEVVSRDAQVQVTPDDVYWDLQPWGSPRPESLQDPKVPTQHPEGLFHEIGILLQHLGQSLVSLPNGPDQLRIGEEVERVRGREIRGKAPSGQKETHQGMVRLGHAEGQFIGNHGAHAVPKQEERPPGLALELGERGVYVLGHPSCHWLLPPVLPSGRGYNLKLQLGGQVTRPCQIS